MEVTEEDRAYAAKAWEFFEKERECIERLVRKKAKQYRGGYDEMMCEVAWRLPGLVRTWSVDGGCSLRSHVFVGLNWYFFKLYANSSAGQWGISHSGNSQAKKHRHESLDDMNGHEPSRDETTIVAARDEAQCAMHGLDAYQRSLIHLRYSCEMDYEEIGWAIDLAKSVARTHVIEAVEQLRRTASPECGASDEVLELIAELRRGINA